MNTNLNKLETEVERIRKCIEKSLRIMETETPLSKPWIIAEKSYLNYTMFREKILSNDEIAEYDKRYQLAGAK